MINISPLDIDRIHTLLEKEFDVSLYYVTDVSDTEKVIRFSPVSPEERERIAKWFVALFPGWHVTGGGTRFDVNGKEAVSDMSVEWRGCAGDKKSGQEAKPLTG